MCVFVRLQIASMGTFQVLKLPLGFIRVLEWVSCNFHLLFCVNQRTRFGSTGHTGKCENSAHMLCVNNLALVRSTTPQLQLDVSMCAPVCLCAICARDP